MKISLGSDHGGFLLKAQVAARLKELGHEVVDCGTDSAESCHYPTYALKAAELVADGTCERGIVICTSGEGVAIAANKVKGIRCGLAYNDEVAELIVEHNNCNMMALGAKFFSAEQALRFTEIFLKTAFVGGRHQIRVGMIEDYEKKHS